MTSLRTVCPHVLGAIVQASNDKAHKAGFGELTGTLRRKHVVVRALTV